MTNSIFYFWRNEQAVKAFRTAVSLHSHTNHSHESLDFLERFALSNPVSRCFLKYHRAMCQRRRGIKLRLDQGYWTPPLSAALAYRLEKKQIEDLLGLQAMVSLSDHDNIEAPLLLRVVAESRTIPVSVEWSAPFGPTCFHLGIHNIPSSAAIQVMKSLAGYTAHGPDEGRLTEILAYINTFPTALVVFNHPLWDLYGIGYPRHEAAVKLLSPGKQSLPSCIRVEWAAHVEREPSRGGPRPTLAATCDLGRRPPRI